MSRLQQLTSWLGVSLLVASHLSAQEVKLRHTLEVDDGVESVAFSPDGTKLASGHGESTRIWDVATGKSTTTLSKAGQYGWCSVVFSPDGKTVATAGGGTKVSLWDIATGKPTSLIDKPRQNPAPRLVFSPDGKTLVTGGRCDRHMRLFDVARKTFIAVEAYDLYGVKAMAFSADSKTLITVGVHDGIKRWEMPTGKPIDDPPPPEAAARFITQLGSADFRVRQQANAELKKFGMPVLPALREAAKGEIELEVKRRLELLESQVESATLVGVPGIRAAVFSPDLKTLAASDWERHLKLWDVATGNEGADLKGQARVDSLAYRPDGRMLASASEDGVIKLWDPAIAKELATLKAHSKSIHSLAFSADSTMLVSGSEDNTIKIWELPKAK